MTFLEENKGRSDRDFWDKRDAGISTKIDAVHPIAHNKIMIIDGEIVITGSSNFTKEAEEKNAENLLAIRDNALAAKYIENWKVHAEHSEIYQGRKRIQKSFNKTHPLPRQIG